MTLDQIRLVHTALAENNWIAAAQLILIANEIETPLNRLAVAKGMNEKQFADWSVRNLFQNLVLSGDYLSASALLWDKDLFYQEPESVKRVFGAMHREDMLLCMGASSMSKSYSLIAFEVIDWLFDPLYTSIKLTSQTEGHLLTNVWPHMIDMVKSSAIQPISEWQFKEADTWLGIKGHSMFYGFSGIAFKQSQVSAGAWKGFKPQPKRPKTDPLYQYFGPSTRLRVTVDEAQQVPAGTWTDLNSVMGSMGGGFVKINAAFNPEDMSQRAVQLAEPPEGWSSDLAETLYSYKSKEGWWVERLDGKMCENVVERKDIFPRLMSYQTYLRYLAGGGDNSPKYWTFCRGFPPLKDAANTVIPPDWVQSQRGEAIYIDKVEHFAAFDMAYQGADKAVMGVARWGLSSGWRKQNGNIVYFEDRLNPGRRKPRHVLTIDQLITMPKHRDTVTASQEVMGQCEKMNINPENVCLDRTGNAHGTYSHLDKYWGKVVGIGWGEGSTETLVIAGDKSPASEMYEGIPSEMWFRFKRWLDPVVNAVLINPQIPTAPINTQLTSRRFRYVKDRRMRIESKEEYKSRNAQISPDEADVFVMMTQLVSLRGGVTPGIIEQQDRQTGAFDKTAIKIQENTVANAPMDTGTKDGGFAEMTW